MLGHTSVCSALYSMYAQYYPLISIHKVVLFFVINFNLNKRAWPDNNASDRESRIEGHKTIDFRLNDIYLPIFRTYIVNLSENSDNFSVHSNKFPSL